MSRIVKSVFFISILVLYMPVTGFARNPSEVIRTSPAFPIVEIASTPDDTSHLKIGSSELVSCKPRISPSERSIELQIELLSNGDIRLFWNAIPNVEKYTLYYSNVLLPASSTEWAQLDLNNNITSYNLEPAEGKGFYYLTGSTELIFVEGGIFDNGSGGIITLSNFSIDKYEITQSKYTEVMGYNPNTGYGWGNNYPAYNVSWFRAIEYCNRRSSLENLTPCYSYLTFGTDPDGWPVGWNTNNNNHLYITCDWTADGYRLPTEMEWQYAAMGGASSQGYTYSGSNNPDEVGWHWDWGTPFCYSCYPVGLLQPNELGIYDMSGNVFEWCWDRFAPLPAGAQENPTGTDLEYVTRAIRGGSAYHPPEYSTVLSRTSAYPTQAIYTIGFRVAQGIHGSW